jgi:hypothetical protein
VQPVRLASPTVQLLHTRILNRLQGAFGGPLSTTQHSGWLSEFDKLFSLTTRKLYL